MVAMLMSKDKDDKLKYGGTVATAFYVVRMLEGIPKDLIDLFTPNDADELAQLEINIVKWQARVQERVKVIRLQKYHKLPLRPNQSLRDVTIRLKILELKKRRKFNNNDSYDSYPPSDKGNSDL